MEVLALPHQPTNCAECFGGDGFAAEALAAARLRIKETERKYQWPLGRRLDDHPGLSDLDF